MKFLIEFLFLITVTLVSFIYNVGAQQCSEIVTRPNIFSISQEKWKDYVSAFRKLIINGDIAKLTKIHQDNFALIHSQPQFLPWHRYFIYDFETLLRKINPSLILPYWDAAAEFTAPHTSRIFSESYYGGNGNPNNSYCISTGFQADLNITFPETRCLRRDFQGPTPNTIAPWQSPAFITSIIQTSSTYDSFRRNLEFSFHNAVHAAIGGLSGDLSRAWSPADLLFFMHHNNVDRLWLKWQKSEPQYMYLLDGLQRQANGSFKELNQKRHLTYYKIKVGDLLDTTKAPFCYTFEDNMPSSTTQQSLIETRLRNRLSPLMMEQYFPKFMSNSSSATHDFSSMASLSQSIDQPLPYPISLTPEMIKMRGNNLSDVMDVQLRADKFVYDMNQQFSSQSNETCNCNFFAARG